jgi:hypothetical protein
MDTDIKVICWIITVLSMVIISLVGCSIYSDYKISEMVKAGTNPIEARMALHGSSTNSLALYQAHLMGGGN